MTSKWDKRFLDLAEHISSWSLDPSTKIGAVAVDPQNKNILSVGYNGFPRGIADDERLMFREEKYALVVHAEANVIYNATFNGVSLKGSHLYVHGLPICSDCAKAIIQVGVKRVVIRTWSLKTASSKWGDMWQKSIKYFTEAGVEIRTL